MQSVEIQPKTDRIPNEIYHKTSSTTTLNRPQNNNKNTQSGSLHRIMLMAKGGPFCLQERGKGGNLVSLIRSQAYVFMPGDPGHMFATSP